MVFCHPERYLCHSERSEESQYLIAITVPSLKEKSLGSMPKLELRVKPSFKVALERSKIVYSVPLKRETYEAFLDMLERSAVMNFLAKFLRRHVCRFVGHAWVRSISSGSGEVFCSRCGASGVKN